MFLRVLGKSLSGNGQMKKFAVLKKIFLSAVAVALVCFELIKYVVSVRFIAAALCAEIILAAISVFCLFSKEKPLKIVSAVLLALAVITFIPNLIIGLKTTDASVQPQYVIHAGGREKGDKNYLNCGEQFEKYLAEGQNLIEVDFMLTSDKRAVCTHRFEHMPYSIKNRPAYDEFMSCKAGGKYTVMSFEKLAEIMQKYPDGKVVFDTKEENSAEIIAVMCEAAEKSGLDIFSRFIIQVYSVEDYYKIKADFPKFKEFWFTNYKANYPFTKMLKLFKDKQDVTTFVICKESWCSYALCMLKTDKKIAVHTENSAYNAEFYCRRGVTYVYADYV